MKPIKTNDFVKDITKRGWVESHQTGSHRIFKKTGAPTLSIPNTRELAPGTRRNLEKLING